MKSHNTRYLEYYQLKSFLSPSMKNQLLKELLENNYDLYTFKESRYVIEKQYFNYLANNHEMIFKDHSKSFCKIMLKENDDAFSDKLCLND